MPLYCRPSLKCLVLLEYFGWRKIILPLRIRVGSRTSVTWKRDSWFISIVITQLQLVSVAFHDVGLTVRWIAVWQFKFIRIPAFARYFGWIYNCLIDNWIFEFSREICNTALSFSIIGPVFSEAILETFVNVKLKFTDFYKNISQYIPANWRKFPEQLMLSIHVNSCFYNSEMISPNV